MTTEQTIKQLIIERKGTIYEPVLEDLLNNLEDYVTDIGHLDMVHEHGSLGNSVKRFLDKEYPIDFAKQYNKEILSLMKQHDIDVKIYDYTDLDSLLNDLGRFGYELAAYELLSILELDV